MFDRAHCIWGQAGIVASICRLDLSNVDMADDIVMYGHILSHNIPETKKKIVKTSSKKLVKKFVKKFIKKLSDVDMADDIGIYGHILSPTMYLKKPIGIDAIVIK